MPTPSATTLVNAASVTGAVSVLEGATVDLTLASTFGVRSVTYTIVGNHDEDAVNPVITAGSGFSASFTMPSGYGQGYLIETVINGGRDELGRAALGYTYRFIVGVPLGETVPAVLGETTERGAYGWLPVLNEALRGNQFLETMAALRLFSPVDGEIWSTEAYSTPLDGGGGQWLGVTGAAPATYVHNGGTIIVPSGGDGSAAWVRLFNGPVWAEWFGASPDASAATNTASIQAAIDYIGEFGGSVHLGPGSFDFNDTLTFDAVSGLALVGSGANTAFTDATALTWRGNATDTGVLIQDSRDVRLEKLIIRVPNSSYPLKTAVNFHRTPGAPVQYKCGLIDVYIDGFDGYMETGILIDKDVAASDANNSEHFFVRTNIVQYGDNGGSFTDPCAIRNTQPQAKACTYTDCGMVGSATRNAEWGYYGTAAMIWVGGGGGNHRASSDSADFRFTGPNDLTTIKACGWEGSRALVRTDGPSNSEGNMRVESVRWWGGEAVDGDSIIEYRWAGSLNVQNLTVENPDALELFIDVGSNADYSVSVTNSVLGSSADHPLRVDTGLTGVASVEFRNNSVGAISGLMWPDLRTYTIANSRIETPKGDSLSRPISPTSGCTYFDTDLGLPIWFDGTNWINSAGVIQFEPELLEPDYWWESASGVTTADGSVSLWNDSVATISAIQGTGANQPTHDSTNATWNNIHAITGDGGDYLVVDTADLALSAQKFFHDETTDWEVVFPYCPDSLPSTRGIWGTNNLSGNNQGVVLSSLATGGLTVGLYNGSTGNTLSLAGGTLVAGTPVVLSVRYIASTRNLSIGVNGTYSVGVTISLTPSSSNPVHSLAILSAANGVIPAFGSLPEFMILKRNLTTNEMTNLVNYWTDQYAI